MRILACICADERKLSVSVLLDYADSRSLLLLNMPTLNYMWTYADVQMLACILCVYVAKSISVAQPYLQGSEGKNNWHKLRLEEEEVVRPRAFTEFTRKLQDPRAGPLREMIQSFVAAFLLKRPMITDHKMVLVEDTFSLNIYISSGTGSICIYQSFLLF